MFWSAPKGLRVHAVQQPQAGQFVESLPDLGEHRAGGRRHHHVVRYPPAQLLGDFVPKGLAAFGVVGPHVDVDEGPGVVVADLAAQAVHFVVGAFDGNQRGVVHRGADDLAALQVGGYEDHRVNPGPRGVSGHATGQIAGAGAGQRLVAELDRLRRGDRHHPVLERERRVHAVVLDVQVVQAQLLAEVPGLQQGGVTRHDVHGVVRLRRQQVVVAPDAQRAVGDALVRDHLGDGHVVIDDLKRAEAEIANVEGFARVFPAAFPAL